MDKTEAERILQKRASDFYQCFNTGPGEMVLEHLAQSFDGTCYTKGDPYDSAYKAGQRNVLVEIRRLVAAGENPGLIRLKAIQKQPE